MRIFFFRGLDLRLLSVFRSIDIEFATIHRRNVAVRIRKPIRVLTALKISNGIAIAVGLHSTNASTTLSTIPAGNGLDWLISLTLTGP